MMVKLQIINKNNCLYKLKDIKENEYEINLEFLDIL